ncbi:MAG: transglutaminase family protein [Gammaproteobacteria bacterium]|nr:transglutaminase family protein [Gammaproteobacteria bacterium]
MKLSIEHVTHYQYDAAVSHSVQYLRLTPKPSARQQVVSWQLDTPQRSQTLTDGFGNILDVLTLDMPHQSLQIRACGEVIISLDDQAEPEPVAPAVFLRPTPLTLVGPALQGFVQVFERDQPVSHATLKRLMLAILELVPYGAAVTTVSTTAEEAFNAGGGVCQDHSHIFVACCRALGVPARYVSGYLHSDSSVQLASHAWAEAWIGGSWRTFDVSNGLTVPSHHLKLAMGLDYLDACPVRGARRGGGSETLQAFARISQGGRYQPGQR